MAWYSGIKNAMTGNKATNAIGGAVGLPGIGSIGKATGVEDMVMGKDNKTGEKIQQSATAENAALGGVKSQMQSDYDQYGNQISGARGAYRGAEDTRDTAYDTQVDQNAAAAGGLESGLANKADTLENESKAQSDDARKVYTESVRPKMQSNMENAMTLKDYMDPNNSVQTAYRNLYANQASGAHNQGLADFGILAALGGQASKGAMAGRAATGSQMAGLQSANMGQAGAAYQMAQKRMQDLQDQGIATGIAQNEKAYGAGQSAIKDFQNSESDQATLGANARAERQKYAGQAEDLRMSGVNRQADINQGRYARNQSKAGARYGEDIGDIQGKQNFKQGMSSLNREDISKMYGTQREGTIATAAEDAAKSASIRSMMTAGLSSGAQAVGSYMGGQKAAPAGGAQGAAPAQNAGNNVVNDPNNPYQYPNPGNTNPAAARRSYYA